MNRLTRRHPSRLLVALAGIAIAVAIGGAIASIKVLQFHALGMASAQQAIPPAPVNVAEVRARQWQPRVTSVGSVAAVQGTTVSAEAAGVVRAIEFDAGAVVAAGAPLVRLDVDVEEAQLRAAEATAELAQQSLARARNLIASRSISQADLDTAEAGKKQADAQVDNIRAAIAKKVVRAPFAGKLGIRRISVGQYLEKGSPVVSLQSLDPVYVEFSVPQQRLGELSEGLQITVSADAYPDASFAGTVTALDPQVDPATRNVRVQATLANADGRLRPGMFVAVQVLLARTQDVLAIPATAVLHTPYGDSVFVVERSADAAAGTQALTVRQRSVQLGARQGDYVIAEAGVAAGEQVVSAGAFKLRAGMSVVIDNTLAPAFTYNPKPDNS